MAIDIVNTRNLFLGSICMIYMFAFGSIYFQIPGLYGENGILPVHAELQDLDNPKQCLVEKLTLLCLAPYLGLNISYTMELMSLVGIFLSFIGLVFKSKCTTLLFFILWALYFSLYQVGQTFLWFQWDNLLLEIGFLSIVVAPFGSGSWSQYRPRNLIGMWLIRWALFRLMFASGVVKLQSNCPTWWGLTALNIHYESQCLPTPLAWWMHHLPIWWHKLCVVATFVIEIAIPFMFFSPIRAHRLFSFYSQLMLQVMIVITGNYNFFNMLTIAMCFSLLDDVHLGYQYVRDSSIGFLSHVMSKSSWILKMFGFGFLGFKVMSIFAIQISPSGIIESRITFSQDDFTAWMSKAVPLSIAIGALSLGLTIAEAITSSLFEVKGYLQKFAVFITTLLYSIVALMLFGISLVPYTVLDRPTSMRVWPVFHHMYSRSSDFHISSSYGLFRRMTGVDGRPEVILEGANSMEGPWKEYEFLYKPGDLNEIPAFIVPHQPRLDWQMWFAALGSYNHHPWLISLSYRLLTGQKEVLSLLSPRSPWLDKPPKYIRGLKYTYRYTTPEERNKSGAWWTRKHEDDYMPVFMADHAPLVEYLRKMSILGKQDIPITNMYFAYFLEFLRNYFSNANSVFLLWTLFYTAIAVILSRRGSL